MIDRAARTKMAGIIRDYLDDRLTAFEFDDALDDLWDQTDDQTVQGLVRRLWYFYDDIKDHKVHATKEVWDEFQRTLLLLESDSVLEVVTERRWTIRQFIASCAVVIFIIMAFRAGWGLHLVLLGVPFSAVSIPLFFWNRWAFRKQCPQETVPRTPDAFPFTSVAQLCRVRRRVPGFTKRLYPPKLTQQSTRSWSEDGASMLMSVFGLVMFAPLWLIVQTMPETATLTSVRTP